MAKKGKQAAVGTLLTMLLYLVIPMLSALLAVKQWADSESLLMPMLLAAAVSAAVGTLYLVRRGKWSVFAAALLTGIGVQCLAMLLGYLVFGSVAVEERRWMLPLTGFGGAVTAGIFLGKGKRRENRSGKRKRR